ncbi:hypothetical protein [Kribbella ginsengisoli]|uniref:Uncharacterized protein n=1 Tax=Kribbella ginsengisoli TaxID=363865 RepID=A0ABP6VL05_9ACTN
MTRYVVKGFAGNSPSDRVLAKAQLSLAKDYLVTVRARAVAWRNGLGALLAGLVGFGLVKGRTDVGELATPYATAAGLALLVSLVAGALAAVWLLRAAHGSLSGASMTQLMQKQSPDPVRDAENEEAEASAGALRAGCYAVGFCAGFLVLAVGVTWYGPAKDQPKVTVVTPAGDRCGEVVELAGGVLTLKTSAGQQDVRLSDAGGLRVVEKCTQSTP